MRVETLLLALAAALPWEGALAYPTEAVSVVKILGVLLFVAWLLRALARSEPLRVSPALAWAGFFALRRRALDCCSRPTRPTACSTRCATRCSSCSSSSSCSSRTTIEDVRRVVRVFVALVHAAPAGWGLYGFVALDLERAAGPIADPNDFAYLMACALPLAVLPARRGEAPPPAVGRVLRAAARRDAGDAVARRAGRARRARAVGHHHAPRPAERRAARRRRAAQRGGARVRAVGAAAQRPPVERRATSPTRTSTRARRCGRARCGWPRTGR